MSKLDDYISKLLHDDKTLQEFLVDPIKSAEDDHGCTKAQRSVLRRVVAHLSTNSTNGYGVVRHLDSYRRSIRLLQNVLHNERGAALATHHGLANSSSTARTVYVYYNGIPEDPTANSPYAFAMVFTGTGDTIGEVMDNATDGFGNPLKKLYTTEDNKGLYVNSFTVPSNYRYPGNYMVPLPSSLEDRDPFWFYSTKGTALSASSNYTYINSGGNSYTGDAGESFSSYTLGSGETAIFWQVIAPDVAYGFQSCVPSSVENTFG